MFKGFQVSVVAMLGVASVKSGEVSTSLKLLVGVSEFKMQNWDRSSQSARLFPLLSVSYDESQSVLCALKSPRMMAVFETKFSITLKGGE